MAAAKQYVLVEGVHTLSAFAYENGVVVASCRRANVSVLSNFMASSTQYGEYSARALHP